MVRITLDDGIDIRTSLGVWWFISLLIMYVFLLFSSFSSFSSSSSCLCPHPPGGPLGTSFFFLFLLGWSYVFRSPWQRYMSAGWWRGRRMRQRMKDRKNKTWHQFDLVNFWINAKPQSVFGMGALQFYGTENGKKSGWARDYYRARDSKEASDDPFAIHLEDEPGLKKLYHDAEHVGKLQYSGWWKWANG